jgi:hypothetical protein
MEATRLPDPEPMNLELDATRRYQFAGRPAGATGQPEEETDRWVDVTMVDERDALSRSAGSQRNKNPQENITI